jgi:hypothetical protein
MHLYGAMVCTYAYSIAPVLVCVILILYIISLIPVIYLIVVDFDV